MERKEELAPECVSTCISTAQSVYHPQSVRPPSLLQAAQLRSNAVSSLISQAFGNTFPRSEQSCPLGKGCRRCLRSVPAGSSRPGTSSHWDWHGEAHSTRKCQAKQSKNYQEERAIRWMFLRAGTGRTAQVPERAGLTHSSTCSYCRCVPAKGQKFSELGPKSGSLQGKRDETDMGCGSAPWQA